MTIPDQLLVVSRENFGELWKKAFGKDPDEHTLTNALCDLSHYRADGIFRQLKPYTAHSPTIRKLAEKYGFSSFKTNDYGGSVFNIKTGVRVHWEHSWYTAGFADGRVSAVGYAFDHVYFEVRKAKAKNGWQNGRQYTYTETSYVKHEQGFAYVNQDWRAYTVNDRLERKKPSGVKHFTMCESAYEMFEEAFKLGQKLKGDEPVTNNTLKKKMLQNIIMTSVLDPLRDETYGQGLERCRIKPIYYPAKAPEDSCKVALSFSPVYYSPKNSSGTETSPLIPFLEDHHPIHFELSTSTFGIGYGSKVQIDFSDPAFDIDKLKAVVVKAINRHYETVLFVSKNRLKIKDLKTSNQDRDADDNLEYQQLIVDAFCEPAS